MDKTLQKYKSQISMIGINGQQKLQNSSILIVGMGGLGCPVAIQATLSGIGRIGIIDGDIIEMTNLHRQTLYYYEDIGKRKIDVAYEKLQKYNPDIEIEHYDRRIDEDNCAKLVKKYDYIIDCSDNFQTRYLLNDCCFFENKTLISGSVFQFFGRLITFANHGACLRCFQPIANFQTLSCSDGGIMNMITGAISSMMMIELVRLILNIGENSINKLTQFDGLTGEIKKFRIMKNENCELCSKNRKITNLKIIENSCMQNDKDLIISMEEFLKSKNDYIIIDVREREERISDGVIEGNIWIPMANLFQNPKEIQEFRDKKLVIHCHAGVRSFSAAKFLKENGFLSVKSLDGGIKSYNFYTKK